MFSSLLTASPALQLASDKSSAVEPSQASSSPVPSGAVSRLTADELWSHSRVVATATAVSALVLSEQHSCVLGEIDDSGEFDSAYQGDLSELLVSSTHWLARRQQADGGWSLGEDALEEAGKASDLPTTMIVRAMFQLTGIPAAYPDLNARMLEFIENQGGMNRLESVCKPTSSLALVVRGCYALAEVIDPAKHPVVPVETASLEQLEMPSDFWSGRGQILPALIAIGIASNYSRRSRNPIVQWRRGRACEQAMKWLAARQDAHGGFDDSLVATNLVVMSLSSVGQTETPVVRNGVEFLFENVKSDGSWSA